MYTSIYNKMNERGKYEKIEEELPYKEAHH